jgi:hypothetical protein
VSKAARLPKRGKDRLTIGGVVNPPAIERQIPRHPVKFSKLPNKAQNLLKLVPPDGVFIGNTSLQRKSKLGKHYWNVRKQLVDTGFLTLGKGRGGSVARSAAKAGAVPAVSEHRLWVDREFELYEPLRKWVADEWGKDVEPVDFFEVRVTGSSRNQQRASGKWSRPDVTLVEAYSYEYLPEPVLDITTFEIKKSSDVEDIQCIFEAAAHSRRAHYSFLVVEVENSEYQFPDRLTSELERFNIGLICMWKEKGAWKFEQREWETDRLNPEPEELNALLQAFFKQSERGPEFKQAIGKR